MNGHRQRLSRVTDTDHELALVITCEQLSQCSVRVRETVHDIQPVLDLALGHPFAQSLNGFGGIDAPICQDDRLGGLDVCLARSIVCHDPLVDLAGEEAFEAPDDIAFGPAASSPSCDVVDGRLVESHADDDGSREGGVGLSVATPIEAVPAGGHPGRGRDRTRAAALREGGVRTNPVGVVPEDDQQLRRGVGADPEALAEGG